MLVFAAYLGIQLLRFAKPPTIAVTDPAEAVITVDDSTTAYTLKGTSTAGATVSVTRPRHRPAPHDGRRPTARGASDVGLRRGRNEFDINATDPETGKQADQPARVVITVPFSVVQAPTLTVDQPADGITVENGAIPVQGRTTNASTVTVSATYVGPVPGTGAKPASSGGGRVASSGPAATPKPPAAPPAQTMPVARRRHVQHGRGADRRQVVDHGHGVERPEQDLDAHARRHGAVQGREPGRRDRRRSRPGSRSGWMARWTPRSARPARSIQSGKTLTFTAQRSIEVRTGSSGVTKFTLNGTSLGALGKNGIPETWLFAPPNPPQKTGRT